MKNGGSISISSQQSGESGQLSFLRQQRAELARSLDEQRQVYGPRHPRIIQTQQALRGLDNQIAAERRLLEEQLKATLDVAAAKQTELEKQIGSLSSGVNLSEAAQVKLYALEREAAADREIYQQFLSRNKQTDELALLVEDNVRVVSEAVPPLRSTRPSITLVGPAIAMLCVVIAALVVAGRNFGSLMKSSPRPVRNATPEPARRERQPEPTYFEEPRRRAKPPAHDYDPVSLLDAWGDDNFDNDEEPASLLREQRDRLRAGRGTFRSSRREWRRAG